MSVFMNMIVQCNILHITQAEFEVSLLIACFPNSRNDFRVEFQHPCTRGEDTLVVEGELSRLFQETPEPWDKHWRTG
jgi:hypothetical protein